ncbi:hypothetical protein WG70_28920 [Burkholderia oklahomensis EO147]|nr:hypothetical protein WG70_28920 [Burkholderia oklahomensis EO147]
MRRARIARLPPSAFAVPSARMPIGLGRVRRRHARNRSATPSRNAMPGGSPARCGRGVSAYAMRPVRLDSRGPATRRRLREPGLHGST